jgi:hypothetical protein
MRYFRNAEFASKVVMAFSPLACLASVKRYLLLSNFETLSALLVHMTVVHGF